METEIVVLAAAAAFLAYAIFRARQPILMAAVAAYAAVVGWIIQHDLGLVMPALGLAIVLSTTGLAVVIYRELLSQNDAVRHTTRKLNTNSQALIGNIGS